MSKVFDFDGDYPIRGQDTRNKNMALVGKNAIRGSVTKKSGNIYTINAGTVIFLNGFTIVFEEDENFDLTNKPCLWAQVYSVTGSDGSSYSHKIYAYEDSSEYNPGNDHYKFFTVSGGLINELFASYDLKSEISLIDKKKGDNLEYTNNILKLLSGEIVIAQVTITSSGNQTSSAKEIELQKGSTYIQWRYVGDSSWKNLVALSDLKGDAGKSAYQFAKDGGYTGTESDFASLIGSDLPDLVARVPIDASIIFDYPNYKSGSGGDDGFYRRMYFFGDSTIKGTTTVLGSDRATLCLPYLLLQHVANASGKATTAESTSNKAIGGASFTTSAKTYFGSNGSLISDQITNLNSTQFGSIFISGGINDWRASSAISEFKNSVSHVMDNLGQNLTNENTIVFWITPFLCPSCEGKNSAGLTLQDYRDAIVDVIHSKRKSSNIKHSIIDGRFLGLVDVDTLYYTDKLHPSAIGNEIIAKNIFDLLYDPTIS